MLPFQKPLERGVVGIIDAAGFEDPLQRLALPIVLLFRLHGVRLVGLLLHFGEYFLQGGLLPLREEGGLVAFTWGEVK